MRYHNYAESFLHVHVLIPATMETESSNCDKVDSTCTYCKSY